ncbi:alpha-ketoglutarate-dependent dioxygenase AlkB [Pseudomonas balearica]|uniref:alpha-ketoglutarate-dependent dioxygenase AlkB family protein n=1 Tax=Stutzerimonas balearica TaxID=74829 RepID=UPI001F2C1067|nr:alpha-ketoglutarate-dependent dioxygenase AlkB [Stutzerimonas balearica]MCF6755290.1 alpha-ketoglutarate-dependent dioxygenase AlkB [Stutzerimonas balearica]
MQRIELADAELLYCRAWCPPQEADRWLRELIATLPWSQPSIRLFGRQVKVPREVAWIGDPEARYRYSGLDNQPSPWTPLLAAIRQRLERELGRPFNGVLVNHYRDGQDAMGWHSDDEPELGCDPLVASLSLGATRRFDLRRKGQTRIAHSLELEHGSLLVMGGLTQHHWQHQIARTTRVHAPRVNLTFRQIIASRTDR